METILKIGDRVKLHNYHLFPGDYVGTVVCTEYVYKGGSGQYGVEFDNRLPQAYGHSLNGKCANGHGRYVYSKNLVPFEVDVGDLEDDI